MKWRETNLAVLYLRVSTEEQAKENYSLDWQERVCRQFCKERGWEIVEVFIDPGVSGWADVERPAFRRMLSYVRQHRNANVVFFDYSRFSRFTLRALVAFDELDKLGIVSIAANSPNIDCRTAPGRTARREELSKAEDFSDRNSENTSARMKAAFDDGRWTRSAPLGYINVRTKFRGEPNIVPAPESAKLIVKAFELVATGNYSFAEVLRIITDLGLCSAKGNKLTLHSFIKILRNPVYVGKLYSRKWRETVNGLHKPLVSEETFRNVQLILRGKKPVTAPYKRNHPDFPLRRFLRCSECGTPLTGSPATSATGRKYGYYWCYKCKAVKATPAAKMEELFVEQLGRLRPRPRTLRDLPEILEREWKDRTKDNSDRVRRLTLELRERQNTYQRLVEAYLNRDKNVLPVYEQMSRKFEDDIAMLESRIVEANSENATCEQLLEFGRNFLVDIASAWK